MKKRRKRPSQIRRKRRRKKRVSVFEELKNDFSEIIAEMQRIVSDGLKRWDFLAFAIFPHSKKLRKRAYKRVRSRACASTRVGVRTRKKKFSGLENLEGHLQNCSRNFSKTPTDVFSFFSQVKLALGHFSLAVAIFLKQVVIFCAWLLEEFVVVLMYFSIGRNFSKTPTDVFSFFSQVKLALGHFSLAVVIFLKQVVILCAWLLEGFVVVLMYFSIGILALVKFICIFLSWIVKGIIVCFRYVGFGVFFILRQIFRFFVYTIREIGYGIAQCFSYVNKRLRHEFYFALRIVGACVLVGAVGFQIFHATHKKQDKGQQIVKTIDQYISGASPLILFAAPGINVMSSESVTSGTSPPGLIQMKPAVADSFQYYQPIASCVTPACGGCVTPACPRLCAVPEKVVPKTNDISPCLLTATIRRTWGRGIGLDDDYTTIAQRLFPIEIGNNIWPFLDVRLHGFDNGELGANIGLGYRHFSSCSQNAFGMNIYYDFRETSRHTRFSQFGIGFEILGKCWDLRVNGYIPIRETRLIKTCLWTYTGGYFVEKKKYQEAKRGADLMLGAWLGSLKLSRCASITDFSCLNFYVAAGPYYYRGNKYERKNVVGGRFLMRIESGKYLSLEGNVTRDGYYKTRYQVQLALNIPIGCCSCDKSAERMLSQPVRRNETIVIDEFCRWRWNY